MRLSRTGKAVLAAAICLGMLIAVPLTFSTLPKAPPSSLPGRTSLIDSATLSTDFSDYMWPTDAGRLITSTFAEYRRTHFHGGIDISTGNQTGFRVFAAREGYVARIRVSPTGYGKMLYVKHPDGFYTTYAHLKNFRAEIDAFVNREQQARGCYPIDIQCGADQFPVNQGDIIAYTGDTGVGSPHLHFEIRDKNLDFVSPLLCPNFSRVDRISPTIRKLAVRPLGGESSVNGSWHVSLFNVRRRSAGRYDIPEMFRITGLAGFEIDPRDQADGSRFRQGIHSHELYIDDQLYYTVKLNRAPSAKSHQSGLYYDWELVDEGRGRFHKLYVDSPSELLFYSPAGDSSGILRLSKLQEGTHEFRIVSTDYNGNAAEVTGHFVLNHPPRISIEKDDKTIYITLEGRAGTSRVDLYTRKIGSSDWSLRRVKIDEGQRRLEVPSKGIDILKVIAENKWGSKSSPSFFFLKKPTGAESTLRVEQEIENGFVRVHVRSQGAITSPPSLKVYEGNLQQPVALEAVDINHYVGSFIPSARFAGERRLVAEAEIQGSLLTAFSEFDMCPIREGTSGTIPLDDGNLLLSYDSSSVFKTLFMDIQKDDGGGSLTYHLGPEDMVLNQGFTIAMKLNEQLNEQKTRFGLFLRSRRGWELLASGNNVVNRMLSGRVTQTLGEVGVFEDNLPPSISGVSIQHPRHDQVSISFRFSNDFAGVEYDSLKMYLDGEVVIPEIDGEHRRALYRSTESLEHGSHLLSIRIMDMLGNATEVERRFDIQ